MALSVVCVVWCWFVCWRAALADIIVLDVHSNDSYADRLASFGPRLLPNGPLPVWFNRTDPAASFWPADWSLERALETALVGILFPVDFLEPLPPPPPLDPSDSASTTPDTVVHPPLSSLQPPFSLLPHPVPRPRLAYPGVPSRKPSSIHAAYSMVVSHNEIAESEASDGAAFQAVGSRNQSLVNHGSRGSITATIVSDDKQHSVMDKWTAPYQKGCIPMKPPSGLPNNCSWIALVERGHCSFIDKVRAMQQSGAWAVVVGDFENNMGSLVNMFSNEDTSDIRIPAVFVAQWVYRDFRGQLLERYRFHRFAMDAEGRRLDSDSVAARYDPERKLTSHWLWVRLVKGDEVHWPMIDIIIVTVVAPAIIMIFLYSLWRFRRRQAAQHVTETPSGDVSSRLLLQSDLDSYLPIKVYDEQRKLEREPETCAICLEDFVSNADHVRCMIHCPHQFHVDCIDLWLTTRKRTCPVCKVDALSLEETDPFSVDPEAGVHCDPRSSSSLSRSERRPTQPIAIHRVLQQQQDVSFRDTERHLLARQHLPGTPRLEVMESVPLLHGVSEDDELLENDSDSVFRLRQDSKCSTLTADDRRPSESSDVTAASLGLARSYQPQRVARPSMPDRYSVRSSAPLSSTTVPNSSMMRLFGRSSASMNAHAGSYGSGRRPVPRSQYSQADGNYAAR